MLTEKAGIRDKEAGYEVGVDDYLAKPFSPRELELRIEALQKRAHSSNKSSEHKILRRGDMEIDLTKHLVKIDGKNIVSHRSSSISCNCSHRRPEGLYSTRPAKRYLGYAYEGYKRNIDPHVNRLRTKIEVHPKRPKYVLTVWEWVTSSMIL
jgi:DNA-binding response OmpR family regulator